MLADPPMEFGQHSLIPHRAPAFANELLTKMFNLNRDINVSSRKEVAWDGLEGLVLSACFVVATSTGSRTAQLVQTRGNLQDVRVG